MGTPNEKWQEQLSLKKIQQRICAKQIRTNGMINITTYRHQNTY
jgi:hypothetical protein